MKTIFIVVASIFVIFTASPAYAEDSTNNQNLPTSWSYAKEWLNLNLFTWKAESKVKVYDKYATKRAQNIAFAYNSNKVDQVEELSNRFKVSETKMLQILEQNKIANKTSLLNIIQSNAIERQKILSEIRTNLQNEEQKKLTASLQEESVNNIKNTIAILEDKETADKFSQQIVSVWRDPIKTVADEKETRVYAVGTNEKGTIDEGVIIDGGEAKITKDSGGNLKIEYAPGTGPSSVTSNDGKKLWKIQMSDGTIIESYTAGGNVVIGKSSGTASNIVVNTVAGGTNNQANVIVGNTGGTSANTVVVGGKSVVNSGDVSNSVNTGNTVNNSTAGQKVETTAP